MSPDERDFEQFSERLDEEWLRERLRLLGAPTATIEEDALVRALAGADPLGEGPRPGWFTALREALGVWPGRLAFAGVAGTLVLVGFVLGRVVEPLARARGLTGVPPLPIYSAEGRSASGLGIGALIKAESERKFREAMAFYGTPEFPAKALPLLREAVAQDPSNDQAQFWLGVALLLSEKAPEAVRPLEEAVRLAPQHSLYKQYLLFAYLRAGALGKALKLHAEMLRKP